MMPVEIITAGLCIVLGCWLASRLLWSAPGATVQADATAPAASAGQPWRSVEPADDSLHADVDVGRVAAVGALLAERLWRLAYAAPLGAEPVAAAHGRIHDRVVAMLHAEELDTKHFPRRPTLMPQLLRVMDDPRAATEKLSRIIAHDPVLTGDVLQLANSSRYRNSSQPIETIQRAIVVLGVDAMRGLLARAMLQPSFRATRSNFPRVPRLLWERTERTSQAAESFALRSWPPDRFEAQLAALLSALGPLVVYTTVLDAYAGSTHLQPDPGMCAALTGTMGPLVALRIARHWETSSRLLAAMERHPREALAQALCVGELAGTLSMLTTHQVIDHEEADAAISQAGLPQAMVRSLMPALLSRWSRC